MISHWLRDRRRRRLLATPFPPQWLEYLHRNVAHFRHLNPQEQKRLCDDLRIFLAEKYWEGCRGLHVTDEMKVTISAQACLLVLGLRHNYFAQVQTVLIYPRAYLVPGQTRIGHLAAEGFDPVLGNTQYRGPVILSWADVKEAHGGHNLVLHEFAHQLDFLDGMVDGTPPLEDPKEYETWREVMTDEFERLRKEAEQGRPTLLDPYGATNEAEFFAVATECFFEQPVAMTARHPRLYQLLRDYYHQDPAARVRTLT